MTTDGLVSTGHSHCLFCGSSNPMSLHLAFAASEDCGVKAVYTAPPELQGYDGIVHGGILASLLDSAMTHCLFHRGVRALTGDLHIRYLQSVPFGVPLEISARVRSSRPPVHLLESEISTGGTIMVRADAKFMECPKKSTCV
ncbi:MAG: PaaI family thioesterase [Candidatus Fermentibacteraceae bacterium]